MPYMSDNQIIEHELEIADLLEQLEEMDALRIENEILRAENLRLRGRMEGS